MNDDIDTLTGPELSAAVAREVMGWERVKCNEGESWFGSLGGMDVFEISCDQWQPHTDRNDCHRVLMRCEELGIHDQVTADVTHLRTEWQSLTIHPLAICRAALRAVREARK